MGGVACGDGALFLFNENGGEHCFHARLVCFWGWMMDYYNLSGWFSLLASYCFNEIDVYTGMCGCPNGGSVKDIFLSMQICLPIPLWRDTNGCEPALERQVSKLH